ncbi:hypothetical protein [Anaerotruncus rubiinfantis]|uniref:hypothetical protein n=1 Tax=Anaerotruncus rubiinfantis TaxID=1720200 RepID=UPI0011CA29E7|nr:hypothetical protein [Anaerotruncus rubiinfantis]
MQSVETKELDALSRTMNELLDELPEMRRELHEELGELAKKEVDTAIAASGLNDASGKVRRWQKIYIGSGGGYAAVRPIGSRDGGGVGPDSAGAITNYLEGGHKIRPPSGTGASYRPRIKVAYVNGYHFYQTARTSFEAKAIRLAEEFVQKVADRLEGGR